jgi:hypothetical protein
MREVSLEKAKEIITEPVVSTRAGITLLSKGHGQSVLKFTRLLMEAEVQTFDEIVQIEKASVDLVHLSGVHKFRYSPCKADELRTYWSMFWQNDLLLKQIAGLKNYIVDVCEASAYRAGKSRRSYGLFLGGGGFEDSIIRRPWRTSEWLAERRPKRVIIEPLSEFYPYVTTKVSEEHELLLAVDALVPKSLPKWSRADICQDLLVAVLTGEATLDNVRDDVPRYIKWFFSKGPSKYGPLSLDTPARGGVYNGDKHLKTLGESIAAEFA